MEGDHPADIPLGEALHFRQFVGQFASQARDHGGAPAFLLLPDGDHAANIPVKVHKFSIDRPQGSRLGLLDSVLDLLEEDWEVGGHPENRFAHGKTRSGPFYIPSLHARNLPLEQAGGDRLKDQFHFREFFVFGLVVPDERVSGRLQAANFRLDQ